MAFLKKFHYEIFALIGTMVVLWQMLLPGYVIVLDMVFGPYVPMPSFAGFSAPTFPHEYLLYLLQFILPGWVTEKVVLAGLFFLLFYLPLHFFPWKSGKGEEYVVALFFAINPFVYERLLAGQWDVLFSYALLFPFIALLIRFLQNRSWRSILWASVWLWAINLFSIHVFVMGVFAWVLAAVLVLAFDLAHAHIPSFRFKFTNTFKKLIAAGLLLLLLCSYWIVPILTEHQATATLQSFTQGEWQSFRTASDPHIGTLGNVAALYGFWSEHEHSNTYYFSPKADMWAWAFSGILLTILLLIGLSKGLLHRNTRLGLLWLVVLGIVAGIFSAGVGSPLTAPISWWFYNHFSFWSGFRDTEKWSAVLAAGYALMLGIGAGFLLKHSYLKGKTRPLLLVALCALPVIYTPTMLFGFENQLQPVWYPAGWAPANAILKQDQSCVAVFLPWHQYYTANFTHRTLAANPSYDYFNCTIIGSNDAELGDVGEQVSNTPFPGYQQIDQAVESNTANPDATVELLKSLGVKYVIFTPDEVFEDPYHYPFLSSKLLVPLVHNPAIALYRIM